MFPITLAADDAVLALQDSLAAHSYIVAACIAVLILAPLILKAFKVNVPLLDPLLGVLLGVAKSFAKKPAPPVSMITAPPDPLPEVKGVEDVAKVIDINELKPKP